MQDTRVYDYMVRSGTVSCKWASGKEQIPLLIGPDRPKKKNQIVAWCELKTSNGGLQVEVFIDNDLGLPLTIESVNIKTTVSIPMETEVFCNGYQSWSHSYMKAMSNNKASNNIFCSKSFRNSGDYNFTKYSNSSLHSWGYTYFNSSLGFTLLASLDETKAFTKFNFYKSTNNNFVSLEIQKDCDGLVLPVVPRTSKEIIPPYKVANIFIDSGDENTCWDNFFSLFYSINKGTQTKNRSIPALAWDSWYLLYDYVNENRLLEVLNDYKVREIPLDYFIIGRGYESAFGDWTNEDSDKFPGGLQRIVKSIKQAGYKAGITVSPFVCSENSLLFKERVELLARDSKGKLVVVGKDKNLGGKLYLLDLYNPEGERYIKRLIKNLHDDQGFDVIKLDFLYAAGLNAGLGFNRTRAQAIHDALTILRKYAKDIPLIACAVPLNSAFGLFEHVNIAPELSIGWGKKSTFFCSSTVRERESTFNAIQTSINRRHLDTRGFSADCGSFNLRRYKTKLKSYEQESLFNCAISLGSLISSSDSIGSYSNDLLGKFRKAIRFKPNRNIDKSVLGIETKKEGTLVKYLLRTELNEILIKNVHPSND